MKSQQPPRRRLALKRETIRILADPELNRVIGGQLKPTETPLSNVCDPNSGGGCDPMTTYGNGVCGCP